MTQINAGRVRFVSRGEYNNSTQYYLFDLVNYNGNSYYAKENTLSNLPTDASKWQLIAEKGSTGPTGQTGATGNGIASITKISSVDTTDTYRITFTDGTTYDYEITNGEVTQAQLDELQAEVDRYKLLENALPHVTASGESVTLNNTANAPMTIDLEPNTSQETTSISGGDEYDSPSPDHPQQVHVVSGDNEVKIENKNKLPTSLETLKSRNTTGTWGNNVYSKSGLTIKVNNDNSLVINGTSSESFTFNLCVGETLNAGTYILNGINATNNEATFYVWDTSWNNIAYTTSSTQFTISEDKTYRAGITFGNNKTFNNFEIKPMISTNGGDYVPHEEQVVNIPLGDLEYVEIPNTDYKDEFYLATASGTGLTAGKWYLKKNIGKVVFTGASSENWSKYLLSFNGSFPQVSSSSLCSHFVDAGTNWTSSDETYRGKYSIKNSLGQFKCMPLEDMTLEDFKTWLSTHNTTIYYVLATPTYTLLNNTLQNALNTLQEKLLAYKGQTSISQINNDLPFEIVASALKDISNL